MNKCRIYTILICGIPDIGKTYLSKDATEHYNTINRLKNDNNWCA